MDGGDVGMVEGGEDLSFALKTLEAVRSLSEIIGQDFYGYVAAKARVLGAVDFAHSAGAEGRDDFIGAEFCAYGQGHFDFLLAEDSVDAAKGTPAQRISTNQK